MEYFNRKHLGDYHDLHVQRDTLLIADSFAMFGDKFLKAFNFDPGYSCLTPGLVWMEASLCEEM